MKYLLFIEKDLLSKNIFLFKIYVQIKYSFLKKKKKDNLINVRKKYNIKHYIKSN